MAENECSSDGSIGSCEELSTAPENGGFEIGYLEIGDIESFSDVLSKKYLRDGVARLGLCGPTYFQSKLIRAVKESEDVIGQCSGFSGKITATVLSILDNINDDNDVTRKVVVLASKRETALNLKKKFDELIQPDTNVALSIGGTSVRDGVGTFDDSKIICATPGRLFDLLERGIVRATEIEFLFCLECETFRSQSLRKQFKDLIDRLSFRQQTVLIGCDWKESSTEFFKPFVCEPLKFAVLSEKAVTKLRHFCFIVADRNAKMGKLVEILDQIRNSKSVVVCQKKKVEHIRKDLSQRAYDFLVFHEHLSTREQNLIIDEFKFGSCNVLISTDAALAGKDIGKISFVVNYKPPFGNPQIYIKRLEQLSVARNQFGVASLVTEKQAGMKLSSLQSKLGVQFEVCNEDMLAEYVEEKKESARM